MGNLLNMSGGSLLMKELPYDAEIEYLESTGSQLIMFDERASNYKEVLYDIEVQWKDVNRRQLMGSQSINFFGIAKNMQYDSYYAIATCGSTTIFDHVKFLTKQETNHTERSFTYINGDYTMTAWSSSSRFSRNRICIFGMLGPEGNGIDDKYICCCKIKSFALYCDNVLIHNLIPVRVGQVGYMYDKVSGQLFGNAGTGEFILGPAVN